MDPAKNTYISPSLVGSLGVCCILHIPKANEHSDFSSGNILILKITEVPLAGGSPA